MTFGAWETIEEIPNGFKCQNTSGAIAYIHKRLFESHKSRLDDITGCIFGDWKVIKYTGDRKWICRCSCGKERRISGYDLKYSKSLSCGHGSTSFKDLTGLQFGEWTAIEYKGDGKWLCKCSCGNEGIVPRYNLLHGDSKSCGCKSKELFKNTLLNRYGDVSSTRISNPRTIEQISYTKSKEDLIRAIESNFNDKPTLWELSKLLNMSVANTSLTLHKFGMIEYTKSENYSSHYETEIEQYILSLNPNIDIIKHNRSLLSGNEIDIYIPSKNIAIEFNGSYWHSYPLKDMMYHQNKSFACAKLGIQLIHIFEYEWLDNTKQSIIKDILRNIIQPQSAKVEYARNTVIKSIDKDVEMDFLNKYHMQGYANSSIKLGLFHNNELLGVMTFGKPRFSSQYTYEIIRLAWKLGTVVIGGAEKLFSHFIKEYNPDTVISYCDISKFSGSIYTRLGFTRDDKLSKPNYIWIRTKDNVVYTRYQTMKQKLIAKGLGTSDQTESEIMESLGFLKVYDAGNLRFIWTKE